VPVCLHWHSATFFFTPTTNSMGANSVPWCGSRHSTADSSTGRTRTNNMARLQLQHGGNARRDLNFVMSVTFFRIRLCLCIMMRPRLDAVPSPHHQRNVREAIRTGGQPRNASLILSSGTRAGRAPTGQASPCDHRRISAAVVRGNHTDPRTVSSMPRIIRYEMGRSAIPPPMRTAVPPGRRAASASSVGDGSST